MLESDSAAADLDLITFLKAIPDARRRRGVRIPAWYPLLVAVLGILRSCHHSMLSEALGIELRRPPSDSAFRYFFRQVEALDPRWPRCARQP